MFIKQVDNWHTLFSKDDFVNPDVLGTVNPHPVWGYAHGPIIDHNPDWTPPNFLQTKQESYLSITNALLSGQGPPGSMSLRNEIGMLLCHISSDGETMCGKTYTTQSGYTVNLCNQHAGATLPLTGRPGGTVERQKVGSNAIKRWVLTGGWRDALFINEPDLQYARVSLIGAYCNFLEQIARTDTLFAAEYGTRFHRPRHAMQMDHLSSLTRPVASETLVHHCLSEQSGQSKTAHRLALDFYRQSESDSDSETISKRVSEIDFEPEDRKDWPVDIATDIFAGPYLSSILIDTAFGPVPEGKN